MVYFYNEFWKVYLLLKGHQRKKYHKFIKGRNIFFVNNSKSPWHILNREAKNINKYLEVSGFTAATNESKLPSQFFFFSFLFLFDPHLTYTHSAQECIASWRGQFCIYKPMESSIERSPQHWRPSEGSNSELFAHENLFTYCAKKKPTNVNLHHT